jgi:hypothetical protein
MKVPQSVIPIPQARERNPLLIFFSQSKFLVGRRGDLTGSGKARPLERHDVRRFRESEARELLFVCFSMR